MDARTWRPITDRDSCCSIQIYTRVIEKRKCMNSDRYTLNSIEERKFRMNQRAVGDRFKLFESTFNKNMAEEEKASGINPPELSGTEIAVLEVIEKIAAAIHEFGDSSKVDVEKKKAEEMRQKCMETFSETKTRLDEGSRKAKRAHVEVDLRPFLQRKKKVMLNFVESN